MTGSTEYVVAAHPTATYEALLAAARERLFPVVHSDGRHLTLTLRPGGTDSREMLVLVAVLDAGHDLSKLVLTGRDDRDGGTVDLGDLPAGLFAEVERRLPGSRSPTARRGHQGV